MWLSAKQDHLGFEAVACFEELITFWTECVPDVQSQSGIVIDDENSMVIHGESSLS